MRHVDRAPRTPKTHGGPVIENADDYERLLIRPLLKPPAAGMEPDHYAALAARQRTGDLVLWLTFSGFFWHPRTLFGIENHFYAFYDHPELMHRINSDLADWILDVVAILPADSLPDYMCFAEDMTYNHGPMLSKEQFDTFLKPYYLKVIPALKDRGIRVFIDSDGQVAGLIPWLLEIGAEGISPLERMAGVDVPQLRKDYPDLLMMGGFDKTVMHRGEAAIRAEFERLLPTARERRLYPQLRPPDAP